MIRHLPRSLVLLLLVGLLAPGAAAAEANRATRDKNGRLQWNEAWPRVQWWEHAATGAFYGLFAYTEWGTFKSKKAKWEGPVLFDSAFRRWLRMPTREGREAANDASDVLWGMTYAFPLFDIGVIALLVERNIDLAWQLTAMGLEAYGLSAMLTRVMHRTTRRGRPLFGECRDDGGYDRLCGGSGAVAGFWSGHTSTAATGAGLVCVHHRYLPLYGHPAADASACGVAVITAVMNGVARVMSDRHYMTDVVVGGAVGFAIGYGLPWLFHYRHGARAATRRATRKRTAIVPYADEQQLGLSVVGMF